MLDLGRLLMLVDHEQLTPGLGVQGHQGLRSAPELSDRHTWLQTDEGCVVGVDVRAQPAKQRRCHQQRTLGCEGGDRDHVVAGHGDADDTDGQRGGMGDVEAGWTGWTGQQMQHAADVQLKLGGNGAICHHLIGAGGVEHPPLGELGPLDDPAETGIGAGLQSDHRVVLPGNHGRDPDGRGDQVDPGQPGYCGVVPRYPAEVLLTSRAARRDFDVGTPR